MTMRFRSILAIALSCVSTLPPCAAAETTSINGFRPRRLAPRPSARILTNSSVRVVHEQPAPPADPALPADPNSPGEVAVIGDAVHAAFNVASLAAETPNAECPLPPGEGLAPVADAATDTLAQEPAPLDASPQANEPAMLCPETGETTVQVLEPTALPEQAPGEPTLADEHRPLPARQPLAPAAAAIDSRPQIEFNRQAGVPAGSIERAAGDVQLEWITPQEISVGQQAHLELKVTNAGASAVKNVVVDAMLSEHAQLDDVRPQPAGRDRQLAWQLGDFAAGQCRTIEFELTPHSEGEITPSATVTFTRASSARIAVLKPQVVIEVAGPPQLISGQPAMYQFTVSNPGNGRAQHVLIEVELDAQLKHAEGQRLSYALGTLGPGETRTVQVPIAGGDNGAWPLLARCLAAGNLRDEKQFEIDVVRPRLELAVDGPRLRYVDRQALYTIRVHNPGPAPANNVQLFDSVPEGFRFVEATGGGAFDSANRQVAWFVGRLEPNSTAEVGVQLIATEPGDRQIAVAAKADSGVSEQAQTTTRVEGISAVVLDVSETDDPVEVGGETVFNLQVTNRGSQPAVHVQVAAKLPAQMEALDASGPTSGQIEGQQIVFDPIESLAPGQSETYQVRVRCQAEGQVGFRAYFRTDDHPKAVVEEELTRIYQD